MRESRLFQILYHLLNKGEATASELAEKFEVSIRTIYRDIDKLSGAGIPVYTTAGYKGGVHLDENFVLKRSLLSKEDMQNILMGVQSLSAVGFSQQEDCLAKLQGLFQMQDTDWIEVDFSRWGCDPERERNTFGLLKEAIQQKRQIHFAYYNSQGESGYRECLPMKLVFKDRAWYLRAYCLKRNAERLFRISRIRNLEMTEKYFESIPDENLLFALPEAISTEAALTEAMPSEMEAAEAALTKNTSSDAGLLEAVELKSGRIIEMELNFEKTDAYRIYDVFDDSVITEAEDRLIVKAAMPEDGWLYGFLMSFGDSLTIIRPAYLKEELIKRYKAALKHFEG